MVWFPSKIKTFSVILNCQNISITEFPLKLIIGLSTIKRLHKMLIKRSIYCIATYMAE